MKATWAMALAGLGLTVAVGTVAAQPYGGPGYGYREQQDYGYRDRGYQRRGYEDDDDYRPRRQSFGFDEREYLRCNPDVRRAVQSGQVTSGADHFRVFGRREGRRLSC